MAALPVIIGERRDDVDEAGFPGHPWCLRRIPGMDIIPKILQWQRYGSDP